MTETFDYDVFLSHSSKDKPAVRELAERLKGDGLRVWLDEWVVQAGDHWPSKIEQGLESSRTLILVMSQNAFESDWVTLERHTVLFRDPTNAERRFIPLRLDDAPIKDSLRQFAYIDWRERDDQQYAKLVTACLPPTGMGLPGQLARGLVIPLATLLGKSACGDVAGKAASDLHKIAERITGDYYEQQEVLRHFQRIGEKIVQKLEPRFQESVDAGDVDVDKVVSALAAVLQRDGSAEALRKYKMQPEELAAEWREPHPHRWDDFNSQERQLYNAALDDAARYLVEVAAELPGFQSQFAARLVQELGSVIDDLDPILGRVDDVEQWVKSKGLDDEIGRFEADYRRAVLRRFDYMELLGADIPPEARRHPLSVAYVSLSLLAADETGRPETDEENDAGISRSFENLLDELSRTGRRLLVRGEAGSGKSTLFRWSALQAASPGGEERESEASRSWRHCIPFLIRLRDYPQGKLPSVYGLPGEVAKNVGSPPPAWVKGLLEDGRALLLFDGVDEVPNGGKTRDRANHRCLPPQFLPGQHKAVRGAARLAGWAGLWRGPH
jgi:hypothetical protein